MKTIVGYSFAGPAGNTFGIPIGFDFGKREYEANPYIPQVGSTVTLSYGSDLAQAAIFAVSSVHPILTSDDADQFDVFVLLE
ncbi:hypothetical protein O0880_06560 [Janthinobacterium sp. SUN118]|uniref:hypothetical protein n=1 Tax=Janthinobacterium sp. SUN118 TaxID=3004100 RepID=UPI0025B1F92F|nr:hypothetical protein [Janthinobacterium sp. SUN118]MDN2709085.1 hypothetical protein [Janthinobacterium sp. SUN118]